MYARLMRLPLEVTPCLPAGYADCSVPNSNEMRCMEIRDAVIAIANGKIRTKG
ncbi:hypothetical protein [Brunnivagina elsteri]|uniref:hypothetical protein n=1 Tax=Brunnivagina elsteri TaxID=1247191 RepID=UPI00130451EA|nr:hypothetical protein [Calothrix elsteri]